MPSAFDMPAYRCGARWLACRKAIETQMVAEGWNRHARKFHEVQTRRAVRMYQNGGM
jgi:hypothetical protein